jgi:hypothetical protein
MLKKYNTSYIIDFQLFTNIKAIDCKYITHLFNSYAKKHLGAKDYLILLQPYE